MEQAERCDDPFQVFTFLFDNKIGIMSPLLWRVSIDTERERRDREKERRDRERDRPDR